MSGSAEKNAGPANEDVVLVQRVTERLAAFHNKLEGVLPLVWTEVPNYYHAYPLLFREEFPSVGDAEAVTIAAAGVFYLNHLCLLDDVVDSKERAEPYKVFMSALLHEEALLQLGTLFAPASAFWPELSAYHREFAGAMLREQAHVDRVVPFADGEDFQVAKGKAAHAKMTTAALAVLANRADAIADLSASQDCFNAARQLYDDVKDWKEDFLGGRYSSLLTSALLARRGEGARAEETSVEVEGLSIELHHGGHIDEALTQAALWCDQAALYVVEYRTSGWKRLIQSLREQIVRLRDDLARIRSRPQGNVETARPLEARSA